MQHHIDQLLQREVITQYPGATAAALPEGVVMPNYWPGLEMMFSNVSPQHAGHSRRQGW
jgi:hypothetical protein